jgi:hypothetical protein
MVVISFYGAQKISTPSPWINLFDGKNLNAWDTYLGPKFDYQKNGFIGSPIGFNKDPQNVFSLVSLNNDEKVIRISGENFGALTSKAKFSNYHLQLKFKWGKQQWANKKGKKMDSGLLYHCVGNDGADFGFWKRSQEFQIEQGNCGDYWGVAGGWETISAKLINDSTFIYDVNSPEIIFGEHSKYGRHCIKEGDFENPSGDWNVIDLYCFGNESIHMVNGHVVMHLKNSQQWDNGTLSTLNKGQIQLQSEGAEIFYKDIRIQAIQSLTR